MNSNIYFICGSTGAGKTTYAKKLALDLNAVHLSIDEFMKILFWMDAPKTADFHWTIERVERCESIIKSLSEKIIKTQKSVILDLGFSEKKQRAQFKKWAEENGFSFELHYLDIPREIRWHRVQERNKLLDSQSIIVDQKTFEWMENYFEPPTPDENPKVIHEIK